MAEWLPDGLWRLILSCSGLWWQSRSQMASEDSFGALLRTGCGMALRWPTEVHFELFSSSADRMAPRRTCDYIFLSAAPLGQPLWLNVPTAYSPPSFRCRRRDNPSGCSQTLSFCTRNQNRCDISPSPTAHTHSTDCDRTCGNYR